jgi:hypothetical protein
VSKSQDPAVEGVAMRAVSVTTSGISVAMTVSFVVVVVEEVVVVVVVVVVVLVFEVAVLMVVVPSANKNR